jgi:hypothetical protein
MAGVSGFDSGGVVGDAGTVGTGPAGSAGTGGRFTGRGGIGGTGPISGRGGSGETCGGILPGTPVCPSSCGDGVRTTCMAQTLGFCPPTFVTEDCDGTDFGIDSCTAHGFAGGTLTCRADCTIDDVTCNECPAGEPSLLRCGQAPVSAPSPWTVAVAATDAEVGLAWIDFDAESRTTLSFARLSPMLDRIGVTVLDDRVPPPANYYTAFNDIAAAPLSSGWVVVACGPSLLSLRAIGADGAETGRAVVDVLPAGAFPWSPVLAARPAGGPLLVWGTQEGMRAAVIAADGRSTTAPVDLPTMDVAGLSGASATFVGDAFYVAYTIDRLDYQPAQRLVRIGLDGTVERTVDVLVGESLWGPSLAPGASDLRVAWRGSAPGVVGDDTATWWQRLGPAGDPISPRVVVGGLQMDAGPTFAFGDDTVVFTRELYGLTLSFTRVALDGKVITPPREILRAQISDYAAARRGPDVVVAWTGPRGLQLARVLP